MKVKVKELEACRRMLHIELPAQDVAEDYRRTLQPYLQEGAVPGFRKGKVPQAMIVKHYASSIQQEFRQTVVSRAYRQAIKDEGLSIVSVVNVENVVASPETGLVCDVTVDVAPEFKLPKYKGIPVKRQDTAVAEEYVDAQIKRLQENFAEFKDATADETATDGDAVQVDYTATLKGKPLAEVVPDAGSAAAGTGAWCIAGEKGSAVPGMSEALINAIAGKEVEATLTLPKDYPNEKLQGKKVEYTIAVKVVRKRILPALDEAFCKRLGVESLDALRQVMRQRLEGDAVNREQARRRDEALGYLVKNTKLEIPQSLDVQETRSAVSDIVQMSMRQGMTEDQLKQQREEIVKTAGDMAQQRVRASFILSKVADEEKIEATQEEINERIARMAKTQNREVAKMRAELEERYGLDGIINEIRCNKAMALVLENTRD